MRPPADPQGRDHSTLGQTCRYKYTGGYLTDIQTIIKVQAGIISDKEHKHQENGTGDTVTFHDAVNHDDDDSYIESDEEDVLLEDLPLEIEEDVDDRLPRKSDINFDEFSLG